MGLQHNPASRFRPRRILIAVGLAVLAALAFRSGRRTTGLVAGLGALGVGVTARSSDRRVSDAPSDVSTVGHEGPSDQAGATGSTEDSAGDGPTGHGSPATGQHSLTSESLTCASCGEPITLGEPRGPNARDEIVHERCR